MRALLRSAVASSLLLCAGYATATVRYVWPDSPSPGSGYTNWSTAAHTIQDAVDAAPAGDVVVVTNGVYATGGAVLPGTTLDNRVCITRAIALRSVNGPRVTIIAGADAPGGGNGDGAVRAVYACDGAVLCGFTVSNGHTRASGDPGLEQ
ncbi:MAG: hypothetical protein PHR35_20080, partial [Kiritimatiellae bacterium]|nr:hypothetical protein [Kiritimatiellia bacterium]